MQANIHSVQWGLLISSLLSFVVRMLGKWLHMYVTHHSTVTPSQQVSCLPCTTFISGLPNRSVFCSPSLPRYTQLLYFSYLFLFPHLVIAPFVMIGLRRGVNIYPFQPMWMLSPFFPLLRIFKPWGFCSFLFNINICLSMLIYYLVST